MNKFEFKKFEYSKEDISELIIKDLINKGYISSNDETELTYDFNFFGKKFNGATIHISK